MASDALDGTMDLIVSGTLLIAGSSMLAWALDRRAQRRAHMRRARGQATA